MWIICNRLSTIQYYVVVSRFYVKKPQKLTGSVEAELKALLDPWLCSLEKEYSKSVYRCEQRFVQVCHHLYYLYF